MFWTHYAIITLVEVVLVKKVGTRCSVWILKPHLAGIHCSWVVYWSTTPLCVIDSRPKKTSFDRNFCGHTPPNNTEIGFGNGRYRFRDGSLRRRPETKWIGRRRSWHFSGSRCVQHFKFLLKCKLRSFLYLDSQNKINRQPTGLVSNIFLGQPLKLNPMII